MKFSETWLRTFVNPSISRDDLSHLLTMAGLEVEELDPVAPAFDQVVVAHVLSVVKHPDADRLNVCQVDIGTGTPQQIVCGAPNVAEGLKVPCALPGANLPGDFKIKIAKVRGIESSGMLCSAKELGISEESAGLLVLPADAPTGESLRAYLDLDDALFTLKLTPNRADCLSLTGIAREVGALTATPVTYPEITEVTASSTEQRQVTLPAPQACPLYCGRVITNVDANAPTPEWMKQRLQRSGIRSISALVDVTNYILLELGQPLHAFDNDKLSGSISARWAMPGEKLKLLNEQTLELNSDILVITDDTKPLAMAGIMGGEESGITLQTRNLFLESAFFAPKAIAGRARRYGFTSDASHRYERGVDFGNTRRALERATALILEICGGQAGPVTETVAELPLRSPVKLRTARVHKVLGIVLDSDTIGSLLSRLALPFTREGEDFLVPPPSYRFDLEIEEDLIEEVARLHGYDNIPAPAPQGSLVMLPQTENQRPLSRVRQLMVDRGFQEVINFSFVEEAWEADFANNTAPIFLANPIASQLAVMRSNLIGGLVANLNTNLKRRQSRVRLFEIGRCFSRSTHSTAVDGYDQPWRLAGLAYGNAQPEAWGNPARRLDYFDLKGDLESLMLPAELQFNRLNHPALHPGRAAAVLLGGKEVGFIGELHPEWVQKYDLPSAPVIFEIDLEATGLAHLPKYGEVSKFPPVIRDLAIVLDQKWSFQELMTGIRQAAKAPIRDVQLFDVYVGKGVPEGKKSLAFRIVMQDTQRTLLDAEVDAALAELTSELEQKFSAQLRA